MTRLDRFGLSWRPELGMEILSAPGKVQSIEIMPEHISHLSDKELKTFYRLARAIPTVVHGVSLGLASAFPVEPSALEVMARVVNALEPEAWSEHLAFVRVPGEELGHLAAPPWSEETVESTLKNIEVASKVIGSRPHLENIATLYHPPGSTLTEQKWISNVIKGSGTSLLLDVENIYANACTFKFDALATVAELPLETVEYIHIAGGTYAKDENGTFFIDDHAHAIVDEVFLLLESIGEMVDQPLTVILERDGNFPPVQILLEELDRARDSLLRGRKRRRKVLNVPEQHVSAMR